MQYEDILDQTIYSWHGSDVQEFLDYAGSVDLAEPDYSFDIIGFWVRKFDGQVLYATDSGCSCPAPWEDTKVRDLMETTVDRVVDLAAEAASERYAPLPAAEVRQQARGIQQRVRELGGK